MRNRKQHDIKTDTVASNYTPRVSKKECATFIFMITAADVDQF